MLKSDRGTGESKGSKKNMDDNVDTIRLEASLSRALNRLKVSKNNIFKLLKKLLLVLSHFFSYLY